MAIFSTHILSSFDGTHVADALVSLVEISASGERKTIFEEKTDLGGRISTEFSPKVGEDSIYEILVAMPKALSDHGQGDQLERNVKVSSFSVKVQFENADSAYHMPFILSPYGFSGWISR